MSGNLKGLFLILLVFSLPLENLSALELFFNIKAFTSVVYKYEEHVIQNLKNL